MIDIHTHLLFELTIILYIYGLTHLDGKLVDITCTETEFTLHIEEYNYFLGRVTSTYSIKSLSPEENKELAMKYK